MPVLMDSVHPGTDAAILICAMIRTLPTLQSREITYSFMTVPRSRQSDMIGTTTWAVGMGVYHQTRSMNWRLLFTSQCQARTALNE